MAHAWHAQRSLVQAPSAADNDGYPLPGGDVSRRSVLHARQSYLKEHTMDLRATPNLVHLSNTGPGQRSLRLAPAAGYRVVAVAGEVWITQAGRIADHVLRPGDTVTLDSPGAAVVTSFGPADIEVIAPPAPAPLEWPPAISAAVIEQAQRRAHELRAQVMHDLFVAAAARIRGLGRRVLSLIGLRSGARHERGPA
jgi:hypothetical protein